MKLFASLKTKFTVWAWNHTRNCAEMAQHSARALARRFALKRQMQMRLSFVI